MAGCANAEEKEKHVKKLLGVGVMGAAAGALWLVLRYERELWARADSVPPRAP